MEKLTKNNCNKICDMCGEFATCLCFTCLMNFCESCFKTVHSMKLSSQHKKEKIDYFAPVDIKCPQHPQEILNLFCVDENGKYIFLIKIILINYRALLWHLPFFKSSYRA